MKNLIFIVILSMQCLLGFCASVPKWVFDTEYDFPKEKYIARLGTGSTAELARTDALAQIAGFFKSEVVVNTTGSSKMVNSDGAVGKSQSIEQEVKVASDMTLTAVEYTQPYYDKKKKTYYITAYINRELGIQNIEAEAVCLKTKYESFLELAESAGHVVIKHQYLLKAKAIGEELLSALYTEVLFDSSRKSAYKEAVSEIGRNSEIERAFSCRIPVFVVSDGDCEEIITNAVTAVFKSSGYIPHYERNKNVEAVLRIHVVNNEKQSDELYSITPEVSVQLSDLNESEIFYSYNKTYKRTSSFSLVQAQKKAFSKIAEELSTELPEDYQNKMLRF